MDEELSSETLRQALAFIDAYELSSLDDQDQTTGSSPQREAAPVVRPRYNRKKELEELRLDVHRLEATLESLKSRSLRTTGASPAPHSTAMADAAQRVSEKARQEMEAMWMDLAVRQNRRRQQSLATNRQLKRSLAKQLKIAKYLQALLARRLTAEEQEASSFSCLRDYRHLKCQSRDDQLVFAHLFACSEQLYAAMFIHIEQAGLLFANYLATHTKRTEDPKHGTVFETVSSTPVPFEVEQTDDAIWNGLFKGEVKDTPVLTQTHSRVETEERIQKNSLTTFELDKCAYDLHSRTVMCKYKESNRIVYVWATVSVLGVKGIRFSSQGMLILERSLILPMNATVLKKWHRYHADHIDSTKISIADAEPFIQGVMKMQTGTTLTFWSRLENFLLDNRPSCGISH